MSYTDQLGIGQLVPSLSTAPAVTSSVADVMEYTCVGSRVDICRIAVCVSTVPTGTAPVITVSRRPGGPGVSAGAVTIATLTVPLAAGGGAIGNVYYKDVNQVSIGPGEALCFRVTTASTAGAVVCGFIAQEDPEFRLNESKLIVSA